MIQITPKDKIEYLTTLIFRNSLEELTEVPVRMIHLL